jgi:hypothetical protein
VFDHNIITGARSVISGSTTGISIGRNLIGANPMFVNSSSYDFELQPGSPAIAAGLNLNAAPSDLLGTERPRGASIGAYEYINRRQRPQ